MPEITSSKIARWELSQAELIAQLRALPSRAQLRAIAEMAKEFSGYSAYDLITDGIERVAGEIAAEERWEGDDLAARYLEPDFTFPRITTRVRMPNPALFTDL